MKWRFDIIFAVLVLIVTGACASIGRPEGGPRDENPPLYVRSNPPAGAVNVKPNRVEIIFDENIQLDDPSNKIVVSPVMSQMPQAMANGHRLTINFRDTLLPDVTYTIDCGDAIKDLNEGNVLERFAIDFSTGPTRDTLVIAGKVLAASNLEPAQSMLVGVHSCLDDSALTTKQFDRIAKTSPTGQFVISNLAPGAYRLYAVNDVNRNYRWDASEDVAFYDSIIVPSVQPVEVTDTLVGSDGRDSIATRAGTQYLPNDILLTWFNENSRQLYLKNYQRSDSNRISLEMGAPADSLPQLTIVNGDFAGRRLDEMAVVNYSGLRDTIDYWLTEPALMSSDTIIAATRYLRTDTLGGISWSTDTLKFTFRRKPVKENKRKKTQDNDSVGEPERRFITLDITSGNTQELNLPMTFKVSEPIASIDPAGIRLEIEVDSVWHRIGGVTLGRDSVNRLLDYTIHHNWESGGHYRFTADSAAVTGIYGDHNRQVTKEFKVKTDDDYSTVKFDLHGLNPGINAVMQLLSSKDSPVKSVEVKDGSAFFDYVAPGTYYGRLFIDTNGNGIWDTGNIAAHRQAEDVYYFHQKINVKKNWDISQTWDINELAADKQKPLEITKNKPKTKGNQPETPTDDDEDDEGDIDPFTGRPYGSDAYGRSHGANANQRLTGGSRVQGTMRR